MKARTLVSICLLAGAAWAQTVPPSQKVVPETAAPAKSPFGAKATVVKPSSTAAPTAVAKPTARAAKPAASTPEAAAKPVRKPAVPAATAVKKAVAKAPVHTTAAAKAAGKRDPFVSPVRTEGGPAGPTCTTGKKCLAIDAVDLKGIVRAPSGMIAVVESATRKVTYFLRENDPVFNGYVVKITANTIVFRENVMDRLGRQSTRDVVKKVVAPPV